MRRECWTCLHIGLLLLFISKTQLYADNPVFGNRLHLGIIEFNEIIEASGIAASQKNNNVLWTHNDSGDIARIFAFDLQGRHLGIYQLNGIENRDWEDIAIGPGPIEGESYLYIGDIGDNSAGRDLKFIYRVKEPTVDTQQSPVDTLIGGVEIITFRYPDGNRDAETLMIDPLTKDIYVISKRENNVRIYRAAYPQTTVQTTTLEFVTTLNITLVVGGDISPSGLEILIKTYTSIYYWCRTPKQNLWEVFKEDPVTVPYFVQGLEEAVGWADDGMGYYTVGEETFGIPARLYFYPRIVTSVSLEKNISSSFELAQNYPNPFNNNTKITYSLSNQAKVLVNIYSLLGQQIRTLVNGTKDAGTGSVIWDGKDDMGNLVSAGVYLCIIRIGNKIKTIKMTLLP